MSRIVEHPPAPGTPEHTRMITASKVPAILGISRFKSQYTMWHEMHGDVEPEVLDPDRMAWGHIAEPSLAGWWLHKHPGAKLNPRKNGTFELAYSSDALPFANIATLDRRAYLPSAPRNERFHIVECKTAMTLDDWGRPGEEDSVPADYYAQAGYTSNALYKKIPQQMLYAKAATEVCRKIAPHVLMGIAYSTEELRLEGAVKATAVRRDRPSRGSSGLRAALEQQPGRDVQDADLEEAPEPARLSEPAFNALGDIKRAGTRAELKQIMDALEGTLDEGEHKQLHAAATARWRELPADVEGEQA